MKIAKLTKSEEKENSNKTCNNPQDNQLAINPKHIWGKIITYLREKHFSALHVACGDIKNIKIENNVMLISTDQDYLFSIISKEENLNEIRNAINSLGLNLIPDTRLLDMPSAEAEADLIILKEMFGDKLKVRN